MKNMKMKQQQMTMNNKLANEYGEKENTLKIKVKVINKSRF